MEKYVYKIRFNLGCKNENRKRHDEIWAELVALLRDTDVTDYSILMDKETHILFGVLRPTNNRAMNALPIPTSRNADGSTCLT